MISKSASVLVEGSSSFETFVYSDYLRSLSVPMINVIDHSSITLKNIVFIHTYSEDARNLFLFQSSGHIIIDSCCIKSLNGLFFFSLQFCEYIF
jgi:hypothetical protein